MKVINGEPYLDRHDIGARYVELHGGDPVKAADAILQRLRATKATIKDPESTSPRKGTLAPVSAVEVAIVKPISAIKSAKAKQARQPINKEEPISVNQKETNINAVHEAYVAGYCQRVIDEYAGGYGLSPRIIAPGICRLLSGAPGR